MLYCFYHYMEPHKRSQIESWDGRVIKTTPAMAWARDKDIGSVIAQGERTGFEWHILPDSQRAKNLSAHHVAATSDAAIFQRVSP